LLPLLGAALDAGAPLLGAALDAGALLLGTVFDVGTPLLGVALDVGRPMLGRPMFDAGTPMLDPCFGATEVPGDAVPPGAPIELREGPLLGVCPRAAAPVPPA
jgi:hypothetical protein